MRVSLKMTFTMAMEDSFIQTAITTLDSGSMVNEVDMANWSTKLEKYMKDSGNLANLWDKVEFETK